MRQIQNGQSASVAATAAGVTLIELLVTLAIMAILTTIAIPSLSAFIADSRQSGRAFELVGALNMARSEAIKRGTRVSVCKTRNPDAESPTCEADAGWEQGWIVFVDNVQDTGNIFGMIDGADEIIRIHAANESQTITTGGNFIGGVSYRYDGLAMGIKANGNSGTASDTFVLCRDTKAIRIVSNRSGRLSITQGRC